MSINIYWQPIGWMVAEIVLFPFLWALVALVISRINAEGILNVIFLLGAIYLILYVTLLSRNAAGDINPFSLPFHLLRKAWIENREIFRSLLLNILLFEPFGAAIVHLIPRRIPCRTCIILAVLAGAVLSVAVEYGQYRFLIGNAEADDVICNSLGTFIGALSLPIKEYLNRHRE